MITLTVRARTRLTPHFARVTLGGPQLRDLALTGGDQAVRLLFPREGQDRLRMPTRTGEASWMAELLLMPKSERPWVRNLTIRGARPADEEIDIEFALHEGSPMTSWVNRVRPGDLAGVYDLGMGYLPSADARWHLLVGDESAVPAVMSILDGAPPDLTARVFLEVPTADDIRASELPVPDGVHVHWVSRDDPRARPGVQLLDTVRRAQLPPGPFYTWAAGESRLPTSLRRHLVAERGAVKADISFAGYWRHGWSSPG
ncbi:siderophore-interacting protein [Streptomyces sp. CWNU-52B]|uniref:siderophore-interacting protein n=1 Tax=unclassified Streptomyces TaxID=2593676 RepID=UPI0039BF02DA